MKRLKNLCGLLSVFLVLSFPRLVLAADDAQELVTKVEGFYEKLIIPVGVILSGFVMMYAGIVYATSEGEPSKTQLAKEYLIGAISGLAILLTASVIINTIIK